MIKYKNLGRNSGIASYVLTPDSITVQFTDGSLYLYNYVKPGIAYVERMKNLAQQGQGLNALISKEIKKNYWSKQK